MSFRAWWSTTRKNVNTAANETAADAAGTPPASEAWQVSAKAFVIAPI